MLIVLQSFSAVANSLDFHVTDTQHLQHKHDHAEHDKRLFDINAQDIRDDNRDRHNPADCHHCGHCDGSHVQWVSQHKINDNRNVAFSHNFDYIDAFIDAPINRLLRPPKYES